MSVMNEGVETRRRNACRFGMGGERNVDMNEIIGVGDGSESRAVD